MKIHKSLTIALVAPAMLLAQISPTVTVTASHYTTPQPDQAVFLVVVNSAIDQGLDLIVAPLSGLGITASNLTLISYDSNPPATPRLRWTFQLATLLTKLKDTTSALTSLQKVFAGNKAGNTLTFSMSSQTSLHPPQSCDVASLIADARTSAQQKAAAAGLPLGRITALSGSSSDGIGGCAMAATFMLGYSGNPGPHDITVTASRNASPALDQLVSSLYLESDASTGLDTITNALARVGISGATLSDASTNYVYDNKGNVASQYLRWSFTLTTPLSQVKDTIGKLVGAAQLFPQQNSGRSLWFYLGSLQASPQATSACPESTLISDATAQAQALAAAAGASVGAIAAISDSPVVAEPSAQPYAISAVLADPIAGGRLWPTVYPNSGYASFLLRGVGYSSNTSATCALAVQFQLN